MSAGFIPPPETVRLRCSPPASLESGKQHSTVSHDTVPSDTFCIANDPPSALPLDPGARGQQCAVAQRVGPTTRARGANGSASPIGALVSEGKRVRWGREWAIPCHNSRQTPVVTLLCGRPGGYQGSTFPATSPKGRAVISSHLRVGLRGRRSVPPQPRLSDGRAEARARLGRYTNQSSPG